MKNIIITAIIALLVGGIAGFSIKSQGHEDMCGGEMKMDHSMMGMNEDHIESMMMNMTARMEGKEGDELDKIFLEDMIVHHEGAVDMARIVKDKTARPEIKAFAQDIIDAQSGEIDMMKKWLKEWFN